MVDEVVVGPHIVAKICFTEPHSDATLYEVNTTDTLDTYSLSGIATSIKQPIKHGFVVYSQP